ncbi:DUF1609 domain-containing protein [Encephalitozoon cuniculi]|nr:DUF1609 domain-containing protein [Encephalitozoon cuniculi]
MRWKHGGPWVLIIIYNMIHHCSSGLERIVSFKLEPGSQVMVFPFIFEGYNIIALPTTKYSDLKKNPKDMKSLTPFFFNASHIIWDFAIGSVIRTPDNRFERLFNERMEGYLKDISVNVLKMYVKGNKTISELLEAVYERIFRCDEKGGGHMMKYIEDVIKGFDDMIENVPTEMDSERKEIYHRFWSGSRKYVESFYSIERLKHLVELEKMVCSACREICLGLKEEKLMGLFAEGSMRKALKAKLGEEEASRRGYLEYAIINDEILLDAHREHTGEVTKELVMQMLLGKNGEEIDRRYIGKVANVVKERQKRREREMEKSMKELLRDEEKAKSKKGRKKKSVGVSETRKEESETEEVEASEEMEISSVEVGGARRKTGKKSKGGRKCFKIHRRVLRWRKSPEKIKEELDRGREERWRGKSLEYIKEQKVLHDIAGVLELLRSEDADKFFMDTGEHSKGGSSRRRLMAIGVLEVGRRRMTGVVEAGTFKDSSGCTVLYHLMFRVTGIEEIGSVMSPEFAEANDIEKIDEDEECQDAGKFVYPKGVRFETVKDDDAFQIVWRNPSDTSEVLQGLTIQRRPYVI